MPDDLHETNGTKPNESDWRTALAALGKPEESWTTADFAAVRSVFDFLKNVAILKARKRARARDVDDLAGDVLSELKFVLLNPFAAKNFDPARKDALGYWFEAAWRAAIKNCGRKYCRPPAIQLPDDDAFEGRRFEGPLESVIREEEARRLRDALGELPEVDRLILEYRYFSGWSYEEIAHIMELGYDNVKTKAFRAVQKLRGLLPSADSETKPSRKKNGRKKPSTKGNRQPESTSLRGDTESKDLVDLAVVAAIPILRKLHSENGHAHLPFDEARIREIARADLRNCPESDRDLICAACQARGVPSPHFNPLQAKQVILSWQGRILTTYYDTCFTDHKD